MLSVCVSVDCCFGSFASLSLITPAVFLCCSSSPSGEEQTHVERARRVTDEHSPVAACDATRRTNSAAVFLYFSRSRVSPLVGAAPKWGGNTTTSTFCYVGDQSQSNPFGFIASRLLVCLHLTAIYLPPTRKPNEEHCSLAVLRPPPLRLLTFSALIPDRSSLACRVRFIIGCGCCCVPPPLLPPHPPVSLCSSHHRISSNIFTCLVRRRRLFFL